MSDAQKAEPTGIGGWLILVALGLLVGCLQLLVVLTQAFVSLFRDGAWTVVTTPGSNAYHSLWAPLLVFELVGNIGFLAAQLWLIVLFLKHARTFPRLYVWVMILGLAFVLADAWFTSFILTDEPILDPDTAGQLGRSIGTIAVWVPYMRISKRVRNTFVK